MEFWQLALLGCSIGSLAIAARKTNANQQQETPSTPTSGFTEGRLECTIDNGVLKYTPVSDEYIGRDVEGNLLSLESIQSQLPPPDLIPVMGRYMRRAQIPVPLIGKPAITLVAVAGSGSVGADCVNQAGYPDLDRNRFKNKTWKASYSWHNVAQDFTFRAYKGILTSRNAPSAPPLTNAELLYYIISGYRLVLAPGQQAFPGRLLGPNDNWVNLGYDDALAKHHEDSALRKYFWMNQSARSVLVSYILQLYDEFSFETKPSAKWNDAFTAKVSTNDDMGFEVLGKGHITPYKGLNTWYNYPIMKIGKATWAPKNPRYYLDWTGLSHAFEKLYDYNRKQPWTFKDTEYPVMMSMVNNPDIYAEDGELADFCDSASVQTLRSRGLVQPFEYYACLTRRIQRELKDDSVVLSDFTY